MEGLDVSCLLSAGRVDAVDGLAGVGQAVDEHVALGLDAVQDDGDLTEVDLGFAPGAWSCGTIASTRRPASRSICARLTRT